jgi:hypothetical protein
MSLHQLAQKLAAHGRYGDTMLAHINPQEAALLKAHGGSGTINPHTGLREFNIFSEMNPLARSNDVGGEAQEVIDDARHAVAQKLDDLGPYAPLVLGAMLGPAGYGLSAMSAGLAVGATYGIANGSLKSGLSAGLSAGSGANISAGISSLANGSSAGAGAGAGTAANAPGPSNPLAGEFTSPSPAPTASGPLSGMNADPSRFGIDTTTTMPTPTTPPPLEPSAGNSLFNNNGINTEYVNQGLQDVYDKAGSLYDKAANSQFAQGAKELITRPGAVSDLVDKTGYLPYAALATPYMQEQAQKAQRKRQEQENQIAAKAEEAKYGDIRDFEYDPVTGGFTSTGKRRIKYDPNDIHSFDYDPSTGQYINAANGGIMALGMGGVSDLGGYSDGGRMLRGPGDGVSDSIPAMIGGKQPARLADGEFVVPARIVSELGNGSSEAGARKLYAMMDRIQHARRKTVGKHAVAKNSRAEKYLPA